MRLEDDLVEIGFVSQGATRTGGQQWMFEYNRFLTFAVHDFGDELLFSWAFNLGAFFLERGMQVGAGETSFQELYPRSDVKLDRDAEAVRSEINRTLGLLRFDLGDPGL